jgi:recombination protein RecA
MLSTTHERGSAEVVKNVDEVDDPIPIMNQDKRDMTKAQLVRAALRVLATRFMKDNVLYLCSNHTTQVIGATYGPKTTTPGGGGIKFAASVRIDLNKGKTYSNDEGPTGHEVLANVTKNKVAPPFKRVKFNMFFDRGVEPYSGVLEILQAKGLAVEGGGWWRVPSVYEDKKFRSADLEKQIPELIEKLKDTPETPGTSIIKESTETPAVEG